MQINSNGKQITLNSDQEHALISIRSFLNSKDDTFFCLSGSAGTGKSTILKEAIKNHRYGSAITAPTHKAKRVIANLTKMKSETIHSLLGLAPNMDLEKYTAKNMIFDKSNGNKNKMLDYNLVCIDESSMLNTALLNDVKQCAKSFGTKVLFIGDKMQLAPVKELFSPVFVDNEIKSVHLSKIERQKDSNPLIDVYASILSDINSKTDLYLKETKINDRGEGICFAENIVNFGKNILDHFTCTDYLLHPDSKKILCYTNDAVKRWNNYIRKFVYGGIKNPIQEGEILMSYTSVYDMNENRYLLQNSCEYGIYEIEKHVKQSGITGNIVKAINLDDNSFSNIFIMDSTDENYEIFLPIERKLFTAADKAKTGDRKWKWAEYYTYRNQYMLLDSIKDDHTDEVLVKKDFDFAYALTIHKSQGSTYQDVFIDSSDIDRVRNFGKDNHSSVNRAKYVGFTRPTNAAYTY